MEKTFLVANTRARLIAFYLPQFHPIPENDRWWGKGFTEWTNVAKSKPLFRGHHQPNVPADLGFYDLRAPETRQAQAEMAREHGIEGFCYWHYWFAGKRLLERPLKEVLRSGEPRFPFCLAWANDSWTGIWHGSPDRILMEQTYPGIEDHENHFYALLDAFADERYLTIDGKKVFVIYCPYQLPDSSRFVDCWKSLADKEGLKGLYFIGIADETFVPQRYGLDALVTCEPGSMLLRVPTTRIDRLSRALTGRRPAELTQRVLSRPRIYRYQNVIANAILKESLGFDYYPCVVPNWDNTPRSGKNGVVFLDSTPELYRHHLRDALQRVQAHDPQKRIVFVKSWNEWAEGNYLEPDQRFGRNYLEVTRAEVSRLPMETVQRAG
jgi:hypothetical protein